MTRVVLVCFLLLAGCSSRNSDVSPTPAAVKKVARQVGDAMTKGDYATVIDHTYDRFVKAMGGREKAIQLINEAMKEITDSGMTVTAFTVDEPGEFLSEGKNTFVVIPTRMEIDAPVGRVIGKSYLLGISSDGGETWTFADGSGIEKHKDIVDQVLPKLPAKLKLPDPQKPEIIPSK